MISSRNIKTSPRSLLLNQDNYFKDIEKYDAEHWVIESRTKVLNIFYQAATRIPAYKAFLKRSKINVEKIKSFEDLKNVPYIDKENYIKKNAIQDLCWDGNLDYFNMIAISSGLTGEPTIWPRGQEQEYSAYLYHNFLLKNYFNIDKLKSLMLICFPMGVYVSGIATLIPSLDVSKDGNLTILPAGNNKQQALSTLRDLYDHYEQIILVGHPLFIKDLASLASRYSIDWQKKEVKVILCSEDFTEEWRNYLVKLLKCKSPKNIISTYGSSELLLMANETPLTIDIRRKLKDSDKINKIFNQVNIPSFFQFNPLHNYIEEIDGELVFTSLSGIPLIKYNIHDRGGVFAYEEMMNTLSQEKFSTLNINKNVAQLPFVYLQGRSDNTVVFYAANIYPEHIRFALEEQTLMRSITGNFVMEKNYLNNMDEVLIIHVELSEGKEPNINLQNYIATEIENKLKEINMEYKYISEYDKDTKPKIELHRYQSVSYFKPGLKPRYIKKK